jgi:hypothetical protein
VMSFKEREAVPSPGSEIRSMGALGDTTAAISSKTLSQESKLADDDVDSSNKIDEVFI